MDWTLEPFHFQDFALIGETVAEATALSLLWKNRVTLLELESPGELNRSTLDRGCCDLTDAGVSNPGGQRCWIEFVAGKFEAWMVGQVDRIRPNL